MIRGTRPDHDPSLALDAPGEAASRHGMSLPERDASSSSPVQVDELKRAWRAVSAGEYRFVSQRPGHLAQSTGSSYDGSDWERAKGERVVAVVGCVGSAGATTFALATALNSSGPTRIVECSSSTTSGLTAAATAELGVNPHGWRQGRRDHVLIQRSNTPILAVDHVLPPTPADPGTLTILDVAWEATQLAGSRGWLYDAVTTADVLVFVTPATTAGMRRLASAVHQLTDPGHIAGSLGERLEARLGGGHGQPTPRVVIGVRGPSQRRWDRSLEHEAGADVATLLAHGALVTIPHCREIAVRGLEARSVPAMLTSVARDVLTRVEPTEQRTEQVLEQVPERGLVERRLQRPELLSHRPSPSAPPHPRGR
ncbi:hypothetical protein [Nocardioides okcheonensis]|uniref:hypothetical protein n=1 Tax=Nocardioides okcheonensis TaxID=2894081 RepID=UPI001E2FE47D|nr:hypothetical protein [Nocardioides okcheonensis]UFN45199.1 hypothetical protein LN652_03005 [Nocardioides okcheonensis]